MIWDSQYTYLVSPAAWHRTYQSLLPTLVRLVPYLYFDVERPILPRACLPFQVGSDRGIR